MEVGGKPGGVSSPLPLCESLGSNSGVRFEDKRPYPLSHLASPGYIMFDFL